MMVYLLLLKTEQDMKQQETMKRLPRGWMSRRGLALEYFPQTDGPCAVARLKRWVKGDPEMMDELRRAGYRPRQRYFPPRTVSVFRRFMG